MHLLLYIYLKVVSDNFNTVIFMGLFQSSACFLFFLKFSCSLAFQSFLLVCLVYFDHILDTLYHLQM